MSRPASPMTRTSPAPAQLPRRSLGVCFGLLCLSLSVSPLQAQEIWCVSSAADLAAQLPQINGLSRRGNALDLRFQSGYYDVSAAPTSNVIDITRNATAAPSRAHRISGGWNVGCTQQAQELTPQTVTALDGRAQRALLRFFHGRGPQSSMDWSVSLQIDRLHFLDGQDCISVGNDLPFGGQGTVPLNVTIDRVRLERCGSGEFPGTLSISNNEGAVTVRNSVFAYNRVQTNMFSVDTRGNPNIAIYNNSFRHNAVAANGLQNLMYLETNGAIYFQNNLIADTVYLGLQRDLYLARGAAFIRNNRMTGLIFQANQDLLITSGNTTDAPGFVNAESLRLASNSLMRDRGLLTVPAPGYGQRDHAGDPRVQGVAPDIGAFELPPVALPDALFKHGFEPPQ